MSANERGGLKSAFAGFKRTADEDAELKLLGRALTPDAVAAPATASYLVASPSLPNTSAAPPSPDPGGLIPRPLHQREPVRQLSFRCPNSIAAELRRKAAFNQLEQQEIIVEGLKRVLADLEAPPPGWDRDV